jgi:crotonobetainyl-CoA:carnitine CoA-transferase CaiB-like acyl-CoA transferase
MGVEGTEAACLRAGVPSSLVLHEGEVLGLEPVLASEFWQGMEREPVGYHLYPTVAYSRGGERPLAEFPAPFVGQHTEEVLMAMGLEPGEIEALAREGVTGRLTVSA